MTGQIDTATQRDTRNLVLVGVGAVVIAATYLYLILFQPTDIADGLGQSSFIAIAGYLIGALLIVVGTIHRLPTTTITLVPVAIAVNIVIGQLTTVLGLPLYLDSIGTILVAVLAGPAAGAATGALTNVIWGMTISPVALPFAVTSVVIGVLAGYAARTGVFRKFFLAPLAGLATGVVAALVSAPIAAFVFGGATAAGTGALVGAFRAMGNSLLASTTMQGLLSDPIDKAVTFTVVAAILAALPTRFRQRFPFVRRFRVFSAATPVAVPAASAPPIDGAAPTDNAASTTTPQQG
ncbi:ECF transporter S component [Cellulomonas cellasea]|uniref:ECF transporter S component n=1 Tax=Cellulomonas cellasea TaxID=43670 RepID=UPI0025A352D0|nr:ECF transporter S component [Cellulomonas cellasea]MDM8084772.1 ECF transporter S component [Cellulomonas cellasea]